MRFLKLVLLLFVSFASAQNVVLNPGFEESKRCALMIGQFGFNAVNWSTPTFASTDFFNSCATGEAGVPANFIGKQQPHSGKNYAGFYLYSEKNYREYVQAEFSSALEKDKEYAVSFWISLAEASDYALKELGVLLSDRKLNIQIDTPLTEKELGKADSVKTQLYPIIGKLHFDDKQNWMRVRISIKANGGERFMTIGNFKGNWKTDKTLAAPKRLEIAYYFIDDVSVELASPDASTRDPIPTETSQPEAFSLTVASGKDYILKNVNFEFDKANLSAEAKTEIERLYQLLIEAKRPRLIVSGHTDDAGSDAYNDDISKRRAASVAEYLVILGYDGTLIESIGFGENSPLVPNNSEENRLKNRRVEFRILE